MSDVKVKLTKKQLKAAAHRQTRTERKKSKLDAVPALPEDDGDPEPEEPKASTSKKRKLQDAEAAPPAKKPKSERQQRWICFCGNLPFDVTLEQLQNHFKTDDGIVPAIRIQQTKPTAEAPAKPKGCAFIEYPSSHALQHALQLHHSLMGKRKINVELTAGGGGSSDARKAKIEAQRKKLAAQRDKRVQKLKSAKEEQKKKKRKPEGAPKEQREKKTKKPWLSGANAIRMG